MITFTDDPVADYNAYDAEQNKALAKLPVCADCGQSVQDDHYYLINDEIICPDCLESNYRKESDDFYE